MATNSNFKP